MTSTLTWCVTVARTRNTRSEYAKWIKGDFGLTPTTGRHILTWDSSKVEVPKEVEILAQSKEQFEKYQREKRFLEKNAVTLDSFGAKWVHDKKK